MSEDLQEVYNRFAATYEKNRSLFDVRPIFDEFYRSLNTSQGTVLDLGCGAGEPFARWFLDCGWNVTGVDFSARMLDLAHRHAPEMATICADMRKVNFDKNTFDAIISVYSLFHIPRRDHSRLFENWSHWLRPGGKVLFTYATKEYTGHEEFDGYKEFLGEQLFYSHDNPANLLDQLRANNFTVDSAQKREIGGEIFLWITASQP